MNQEILKDISITFEKQDFVSIVGPSGSGKSTFLKLCSHLISPVQGKILYNDKDMCHCNPLELRKKIAYVFQTPHLFGNTVEDNMKFPYNLRNKPYEEKNVDKWFKMLGLDLTYLSKDINKLSGGEKQRIAFVRSILFLPEILLLDEVTSALDQENSQRMEEVVRKLNQEGVTILWITHDRNQNTQVANKIITFESGRIKAMEER